MNTWVKYYTLFTFSSPSFRDLTPFLTSLDDILQQLTMYKHVAIIGDININIVPNSVDTNADEYLNITASHTLHPADTFPIRLTNCLDYILLRSTNPTTTLVLDSLITDHHPIVIISATLPL